MKKRRAWINEEEPLPKGKTVHILAGTNHSSFYALPASLCLDEEEARHLELMAANSSGILPGWETKSFASEHSG